MRLFIGLLLALVCSGTVSAAADANKQLKTFITLARETAATLPSTTDDTAGLRSRSPKVTASALLDYLERQPAPLALESIQSSVQQLRVLLPDSPKLRRAGDTLITTLTKERDEQLASYRAKVDALLKTSAQACLAATVPGDLDATLKALTAYQRPDETRPRGSIDSSAQQRATQMFQFVSRWQDYLGARGVDPDRARQALVELRNLVDPTLIPRSKLFETNVRPAKEPAARAAKPDTDLPSILTRLETVISLSELAPIVGEIERIASSTPDDPQLTEFARSVRMFSSAQNALKSGEIDIALFSANGHAPALFSNRYCTPRMAVAFKKLTLELRLETLRSVFKDSGILPLADEPIDIYILRVAQAAVNVENWEYALRTLEFYRALFPATTAPAWTSRELQSCTTYVAARRLDDAGQLPQAILAYHDALRAAGKLTPVPLISARLAAIKSSNPEAFDAAEKLPRVILDSRYPGMDPFRQQPQFNQPPTYLVPRAEKPFNR